MESKYTNATLSGRSENRHEVDDGCQIERWMLNKYFIGGNIDTWNEPSVSHHQTHADLWAMT